MAKRNRPHMIKKKKSPQAELSRKKRIERRAQKKLESPPRIFDQQTNLPYEQIVGSACSDATIKIWGLQTYLLYLTAKIDGKIIRVSPFFLIVHQTLELASKQMMEISKQQSRSLSLFEGVGLILLVKVNEQEQAKQKKREVEIIDIEDTEDTEDTEDVEQDEAIPQNTQPFLFFPPAERPKIITLGEIEVPPELEQFALDLSDKKDRAASELLGVSLKEKSDLLLQQIQVNLEGTIFSVGLFTFEKVEAMYPEWDILSV